MTSYKRIGAVKTTINILRFLADQREPVTGLELAQELGLAHGTMMCYLATLTDAGFVKLAGERFCLGPMLSVYWARAKAKLEAKRDKIDRDLAILKTGKTA